MSLAGSECAEASTKPTARCAGKWEEIDWIAGFAGIPAKFAAVPQENKFDRGGRSVRLIPDEKTKTHRRNGDFTRRNCAGILNSSDWCSGQLHQ